MVLSDYLKSLKANGVAYIFDNIHFTPNHFPNFKYRANSLLNGGAKTP